MPGELNTPIELQHTAELEVLGSKPFTRCRPKKSVVLCMKTKNERQYLEKIEIYGERDVDKIKHGSNNCYTLNQQLLRIENRDRLETTVPVLQLDNVPVSCAKVEDTPNKTFTRTVPNILKTSTIKTQAHNKGVGLNTNSDISDNDTMPETIKLEKCNVKHSSAELLILGNKNISNFDSRKHHRKRKQDYTETLIRQDTPVWDNDNIITNTDEIEEINNKNDTSQLLPKNIESIQYDTLSPDLETNNRQFDKEDHTSIEQICNPLEVETYFLSSDFDSSLAQKNPETISEDFIDFSDNYLFQEYNYDYNSSYPLDTADLLSCPKEIETTSKLTTNIDTYGKCIDDNANEITEKTQEQSHCCQLQPHVYLEKELLMKEPSWMKDFKFDMDIELGSIFEQDPDFDDLTNDGDIHLDELAHCYKTDLHDQMKTSDINYCYENDVNDNITVTDKLTICDKRNCHSNEMQKIWNSSLDCAQHFLEEQHNDKEEFKEIVKCRQSSEKSEMHFCKVGPDFDFAEKTDTDCNAILMTETMLRALIQEAYPEATNNRTREILKATEVSEVESINNNITKSVNNLKTKRDNDITDTEDLKIRTTNISGKNGVNQVIKEEYQCPFCVLSFPTQRSLSLHCTKKHRGILAIVLIRQNHMNAMYVRENTGTNLLLYIIRKIAHTICRNYLRSILATYVPRVTQELPIIKVI